MLEVDEARAFVAADKKYQEVLFPFLIGNELTGKKDSLPDRYVIDFHPRDLFASKKYGALIKRVEKLVLPDRAKAAEEEDERNKEALAENKNARVNHHHANFLNKWWQLSWPREEMKAAIAGLPRYIVCSRVTMRPIFEFVHPNIRPNDALSVFPLADDYSFGVLQSDIHWAWFVHRCSTQNGRPRYTSDTVFDSFPWPQSVDLDAVKKVAAKAVALRTLRNKLKVDNDMSLRELYRTLEAPGSSPLKKAHADLNNAVREAYGMTKNEDALSFLLKLNGRVAAAEAAGRTVVGPGLPPVASKVRGLISTDCLSWPTKRKK